MKSPSPKPRDKDAFSELGVTATLLLIYAAARISIESNTVCRMGMMQKLQMHRETRGKQSHWGSRGDRGEKREKKTALLPTARRLVIGLGGIMYE